MALFVFTPHPALADDGNLPFSIECEFLTYDRTAEIVFSTGNVYIKRPGIEMRAKEATFFRQIGEIFMKKEVKIEDGTTTIICDEAQYNVTSGTAYFRNVLMKRKSLRTSQKEKESQPPSLDALADEAYYDRNNDKILLVGNVKVTDSSTTIICSRADYDIKAETATFSAVRIKQDEFYVVGNEVEKDNDVYFFNKAYITSCDEPVPHYKISSPRLKLIAGDSISMNNVVFSIHGVPAFYFPYYWQKIGEKKWNLSVRLGRSLRKGTYINTKFRWNWTKNFRSYFINDYFSHLGYGKGLELDYAKDEIKSNLYAYHIDEKSTGIRNMTFRHSHWQKLPADFLWQSYIEFQDFSVFNSDYMKDESDELKPTYKRSRVSLTKLSEAYYFRLSGYRNEVWSDKLNRYEADNVIAPEAYLRLNPRKIKFLQYDFIYNFRNYYNMDINNGTLYREYASIHDSQFRIFESFRLLRGLTLFPRFGYLFSKTGNQDLIDYYVHDINLTSNFYKPLKFTFIHNYEKRIGGETVYRNVAVSDEWRPARGVVFRQSAIYDIEKSSQIFKKRFSPLQNQLNITSRKVDYYLRNYFDVRNSETLSWEAEAGGRFFSTRVTHNIAEKNFVNLFQTLSFKLGEWNVKLRGRAYFNYDNLKISGDSLMEKEIVINKKLHCWDLYARYLVTSERREAWIFFNISVFPDKPIGIYHDAVEDEWSLQKK
ncbi:MAG: hypothetical protein COT16_02945 [Elusimicrobia bacterium CG08_land_8_20_14_0_20_44_26]|nr:MAG: hypothetical protein COT16_02945 [Elusimicrobia bacterium CG08_land_8_20_14_0_20_44_26]